MVELQRKADKNSMRDFYFGLKEACGPQIRGTTKLKAQDGERMLQERHKITERFAYHFNNWLNIPGTLDDCALEKVNQQPVIRCLHDELSFEEFVVSAV